MRLSDAERKVMEVVWNEEGSPAKIIAQKLGESVGWKKTTTYTMISVCINKGYLRREDPHFQCYSIASRNQVAEWETDTLIANNYAGQPDLLVAALVNNKKLSADQLARIYESLKELEENQ